MEVSDSYDKDIPVIIVTDNQAIHVASSFQ